MLKGAVLPDRIGTEATLGSSFVAGVFLGRFVSSFIREDAEAWTICVSNPYFHLHTMGAAEDAAGLQALGKG
jgi:hypothetical protein